MDKIQVDLGPVLPIHKQDWDATEVYEYNNIVFHEGATYWMYNRDSYVVGSEPSENSEYWQVMVSGTADFEEVEELPTDEDMDYNTIYVQTSNQPAGGIGAPVVQSIDAVESASTSEVPSEKAVADKINKAIDSIPTATSEVAGIVKITSEIRNSEDIPSDENMKVVTEKTIAETLENNYLPLTGGIIKGAIAFSLAETNDYIGSILAHDNQNGQKRLLFDTHEEGDNGALLILNKGSNSINPGSFNLTARNIDSTKVVGLLGTPDGILTWNGKNITNGSQSMPSSRYIDLTLATSGTIYKAPENGYVVFHGVLNINHTSGDAHLFYSNAAGVGASFNVSGHNSGRFITIPVAKNQTFKCTYTNIDKLGFRFIYSQGAK